MVSHHFWALEALRTRFSELWGGFHLQQVLLAPQIQEWIDCCLPYVMQRNSVSTEGQIKELGGITMNVINRKPCCLSDLETALNILTVTVLCHETI